MQIIFTTAGISPVHDFKQKVTSQIVSDRFFISSPHKVMKHLDDSIMKETKNVTHNPQMEQNLYMISKDLVSAILSKLEVQDKITRITRESLEASGKNKGITAIETRRILDYISRTLSGNILSITRESTEPELHRLVYGLAQIAAEVSIVSALKDITYAVALSKKQSVDMSLRRKRSTDNLPEILVPTPVSQKSNSSVIYNAVLNKSLEINKNISKKSKQNDNMLIAPYSVVPKSDKSFVQILNSRIKIYTPTSFKGFLNQTILDNENGSQDINQTVRVVLDKAINESNYERTNLQTLDTQELSMPGLVDDWVDTKENIYKPALNPSLVAEMEIDQPEIEDETMNIKKTKQKLEKLEVKAKKAILYAGDVAYLTAASVVALRRALTASIEVQMSVRYAKNGMSNHQDLMMNLAKTAAQQAGKEAKSASSKASTCERVIKLALKYTAQSHGANLSHVANRIVMDTLSLATLAKSMAFVSSEIAINSLYQATDVKPPS